MLFSLKSLTNVRPALVAVLSLLVVNTALGAVPRRGIEVPELEMLDDAMAGYIEQKGIGAGLFAVMKDGVIVLHRSYGWKNAERTEPLEADAIMRLASVTKPFTAAAIRHLIDETDLTLDTPIFDLGGNGGVLQLSPFPSLGDGRLKDVTIKHCLRHRGGWDRSVTLDPTYQEIVIAAAMGVASPPSRVDTARYIMGQPLQFTPGEKFVYSNVGYMLLGLVIEEKSGESYMDYVRDRILRPIGVKDCEVIAGRTFREDQDPREPVYESWEVGMNVYAPWMPVSAPYGAWNHEARISQGRLVASPTAILRFLREYQVGGGDIGVKLNGSTVWKWHNGNLAGTTAVAQQSGSISYVVILNQRVDSGEVKDLIDAYLASKSFDWPTTSKETETDACDWPETETETETETEETPESAPQLVFIRGDCDGNGRVDSSDLYVLSAALAHGKSVPCRAAFDVNGDGQIDYSDVTHLSNFIHARGKPPVAPFPRCGPSYLSSDKRLGCDKPSCKPSESKGR